MISHYYISVLVLIIIVCLAYGIWKNDYQEGYVVVYGNSDQGNGSLVYSYQYGNVVLGGNTVTNQPGNITYGSLPNIRYDPNNYDTVFHPEFASQDTTLPPDKNSTVPGSQVVYRTRVPGSILEQRHV
jgi:hypothetical protein